MKAIQLDYKVSRSARPEWLLYFAADASSYFKEVGDDNAVVYKLERLSEILNTRSFYLRKLKRSCETIRREIVNGKLQVYNSTGTKILLEISYK